MVEAVIEQLSAKAESEINGNELNVRDKSRLDKESSGGPASIQRDESRSILTRSNIGANSM